MSERKYTDEEIMKALECCQSHTITDCRDCPNRASGDNCVNELMRNALDLINRQKAEIAVLTTAVDNSTKEFLKLHDEYQDQKKEIERLKADVRICESEIRCERIHRGMAKAEAIKEFAERLHKGIDDFRDKREMVMLPYTESALLIIERKIDNLVAELTEGE